MRTDLHLLLAALLLSAVAPCHANIPPPGLRLSDQLQFRSVHAVPPTAQGAGLRLQLATDMRSSILTRLVLLKGQAMLGIDYVLGANRSDAVDCSALVQQMFRSAGLQVPRTSLELVTAGRPVSTSGLQAGDVLFYRWGKRGLHVAVYLDDGRILHASTSARVVMVSPLTPQWQRRLVAARRLI